MTKPGNTDPAIENAFEDAAKAAFIKAQSVYRNDHDHIPLKATWETTSETVRDGWRAIAHAAIEAGLMPPLGTQPEPRMSRRDAIVGYLSSDTKPDENGWLPIETAPKDGTTVLLYCPEVINRPYYNREESPPNICFGFWGNASQFYADTQQHWRAVDFETDTFGGSEWTGSWVEHSFIDVVPTHWQYLPGAPKPPVKP